MPRVWRRALTVHFRLIVTMVALGSATLGVTGAIAAPDQVTAAPPIPIGDADADEFRRL